MLGRGYKKVPIRKSRLRREEKIFPEVKPTSGREEKIAPVQNLIL
jgi:hypothetical protein